jgi:hypothetical protein
MTRPAILITRPRRLSCRRCAESARPKRLLTPCKIRRTGERDNAIAHPLRIGDVSLAGRDVPTYRPLNNDTMKTMIALFFPKITILGSKKVQNHCFHCIVVRQASRQSRRSMVTANALR